MYWRADRGKGGTVAAFISDVDTAECPDSISKGEYKDLHGGSGSGENRVKCSVHIHTYK